jgi:hypothetical protein
LGFITTIVLHDILTPGIFKSFNEFFTVLFVAAEEAPNFDFFFSYHLIVRDYLILSLQ